MPNVVTVPVNVGAGAAQVARVTSDAVCMLLNTLVRGVLGTGQKEQHALACVVTGGVIGSIQMLASIIGKETNSDEISAEAITNDTILLAALVSAVSFTVEPSPEANAVSVNFRHEPATYRKAMDMFQKLTGRSAAGLLHSDMAAYAAMTDADILLAECTGQTKN